MANFRKILSSLLLAVGWCRAEIPLPEVPDDFEVSIFAAPPEVNYPVCLTVTAKGSLFVGIDKQGSLGKDPDGGKVVVCVDRDNDGKAEIIKTFAEMDHPRGLVYDNGYLWVLHPPYLTRYHDMNLDGVADASKLLIEGISTDMVKKRGADHTTNGLRLGIDGWIYIAVGDFGFKQAKAIDGTVLDLQGGGIVRIRPDGTEMELYATGLRNVMDLALDPFLNGFVRDNTNDGGGWNTRVAHIIQSGHYGYPSHFKTYTEEIVHPLKDYGGGSGCGALFLAEPKLPEPYRHVLLTCDWGRGMVYRHTLEPKAASFEDPGQHDFIKISRPTDIDVDGNGRLYVSSWHGGKFKYDGEDIGFIARVSPKNLNYKPFPELTKLSNNELLTLIANDSAVTRLHAQRELLRRTPDSTGVQALIRIVGSPQVSLEARAAAVFTLKQWAGTEANPILAKMAGLEPIREFALRALTDRKTKLSGVPIGPFIKGLEDANPRVQAQALIGLGRLGNPDVALGIVPLTADVPKGRRPKHDEPYPVGVIPHLASRTLVTLNAHEDCLAVLANPKSPHKMGVLRALRFMHNTRTVNRLIEIYEKEQNAIVRLEIINTLVRLYHKEKAYDGSWWGTRPNTTGPYYHRETWLESEKIESTVRKMMDGLDLEKANIVENIIIRHRVGWKGFEPPPEEKSKKKKKQDQVPDIAAILKGAIPEAGSIGKLDPAEARAAILQEKGNAKVGQKLFNQQGCAVCHTVKDGEDPKGPHLATIATKYSREEILESILEPNKVIAQGFGTEMFTTSQGETMAGFVIAQSAESVTVRNITGETKTMKTQDIKSREPSPVSTMPPGLVAGLTPKQVAGILAYLESLGK